MNVGHIAGGTNAGWRKTKQKPEAWSCKCHPHLGGPTTNPGYLVKCLCGKTRPN